MLAGGGYAEQDADSVGGKGKGRGMVRNKRTHMDTQDSNLLHSGAMALVKVAISQYRNMQPDFSDMDPSYNLAKFSLIQSMLHSVVEVGLKSLVLSDYRKGHSLGNIYGVLFKKDRVAADYLNAVFVEAVGFYRLCHSQTPSYFQSLKAFLEQFGHGDLYTSYRYWTVESRAVETVQRAFLPRVAELYYEVLRAIATIQVRRRYEKEQRLQGVCWRVDTKVMHALNRRALLLREAGDELGRWVSSCTGQYRYMQGMEDAACTDFQMEGLPKVSAILRLVKDDLTHDEDGAVSYWAHRLEYLREGSQEAPQGLMVKKAPVSKYTTEIRDPSGEKLLAWLGQMPDGAWLVHMGEIPTAAAWTREDAERYIIAQAAVPVHIATTSQSRWTYTVLDHPESQLKGTSLSPDDTDEDIFQNTLYNEYEFRMWTDHHGIKTGERIVMQFPSHWFERGVHRLDGRVTAVDGSLVRLSAQDVVDLLRCPMEQLPPERE